MSGEGNGGALPAAPAWFAYRRHGERRLAVIDPRTEEAVCADLGPQDEASLLAMGGLDAEAVQAALRKCPPLDLPAVFDPPVARPSKILCLGKNFAAHAAEFGAQVPEEPMFFAKVADTLVAHGAPVRIPHWLDTRVDHEIELGVVLGFPDPDRRGRKYVRPEHALELVAGYTILNDVTARKMQGTDRDAKKPWLRSKSFDTFCPLGPWVVPRDLLPEVGDLELELRVNGVRRQHSRTSLMVVKVADALAYLSRHTTLRPGDLIAMGTPEGVGPVQHGDLMECRIDRLGCLSNPVVKEVE
ncbi:MAG: fumarylacetoacetate hydrolase family protein [Planctomycetes bacterium]|nr:fumarylacetoacetate hydrolase family protein [Planctomycetota bacterium]